MAKRERTNYAFRFEWSEKIAHLAPLVRLEVYEAAGFYAKHGSLPAMNAEAEAAFREFILPDFLRREKAARYRAKAKARKENTGEKSVARATPAGLDSDADISQKQEYASDKPKGTYTPNRRQRRILEMEARREARKKKRTLAQSVRNI